MIVTPEYVLKFDNKPTARRFLFCGDKVSGFFGGIRNSKTTSAVCKGIEITLAWPGGRGLVGRQDFTDLQTSTQKEFFLRFNHMNSGKYSYEVPSGGKLGAHYNQNQKTLYLDAIEYEIQFRHMSEFNSASGLKGKGAEYSWIYFDEIDEIPEEAYDWHLGRLSFWTPEKLQHFKQRWGDYQLSRFGQYIEPKHFIFVTGNPTPKWPKKRFKEASPNAFTLFEASTEENRESLPPGYIEDLRARMPPVWVKRFLDGSWDAAEGAIYSEFDETIHMLDPFTIPDHWDREIGMDHGARNPTAVGWFAIDEDGNYFLYDLHYEAGKDVDYHAEIIKKRCAGQPIKRTDGGKPDILGDPSMFSHYQSGLNSVAELYSDQGIFIRPANNDVKAGILRNQHLLHVDSTHRHPITKKLGAPRFYVIKGDYCKPFIDEIKTYEWKDARPNENSDVPELPKKKNDHAMDMWKYVTLTRVRSSSPIPRKLTSHDFAAWQMRQLGEKAFEPTQTEEED